MDVVEVMANLYLTESEGIKLCQGPMDLYPIGTYKPKKNAI